MRLARSSSLALAAAALLHLAPSTLSAQGCFGPDGLSGPCWDPAFANLPSLPPFELPSTALCWSGCDLVSETDIELRFGFPVPVGCGEFDSQVEVRDVGAGVVAMSGLARLDYTRTWEEFNGDPTAPVEYQVWRFLVKIDMQPGLPGFTFCYEPTCMSAWPTGFFYGYVDYALNCATGDFEQSAVLYHPCDKFSHLPGISSRPGVFHPGGYTALVGPDTAANPFVPAIGVPASGPLFSEAVRTVNHPLVAGACVMEERIVDGFDNVLGTACLCPLSPSAAQSASDFSGVGSCVDATGVPSSFQSLNFFSPTFLPYAGLMRTSIGTWTTGASYPGPEAVYPAEGFFLYHDSGAAVLGVGADTVEFHYGATTEKGFEVIDSIGIPIESFTDTASNWSVLLTGPFFTPVLGTVKPSEHLIYVNRLP